MSQKHSHSVRCSECGEDHYTDEVEFLNIEEDFYGRDPMTFRCLETGAETKALVTTSRYV